MWWLILLLVLAAAVAAAVVVVRTRKPATTGSRPPGDVIAENDLASVEPLRRLRVGDIVEYQGAMLFVRGRLDFDESGYTWTEHFLDDAEARRWLSVEDDEGFEVSLWRSIPAGDVEQGAPGDRDVIVGGVAYRLQERGSASFRAQGSTGTAPQGTAEYVDYASADGKQLLGFENFGGSWEASLGEPLQPWELTVYPGSDEPGAR
ncbi:DUF4178 domain-containing protein [Nocardioides sp. CPCC 205120]|uniref:DUF4178 domain-containing protein n=1 Tax=Nocardioides sp. CPCC 205120 TaxID=3406462 RepID=UPI003B50C293